MHLIQKKLLFLTRPDFVFYSLIWLMGLLVVGTIAQKYIGLYQAQRLFFSSWVIWWDKIPLPGGLTTLGAISISLSAKLCLNTRWSWRNSGTILTHISALLLLFGGLVTHLYAQEGNMMIYEGERSAEFSDYYLRELSVTEIQGDEKQIRAFPWEVLHTGRILSVPALSLEIEILKICQNCAFIPQQSTSSGLQGMAQEMDIVALPPEKEWEQNRSALQFKITHIDTRTDRRESGIYLSADFIDQNPVLHINGTDYRIALQHKKTRLPFEIELIDFEKQMHPATQTPKSYHSEVILHDQGSSWRSVIRMNEPLRLHGYTFYQSSFVEADAENKEATILAVVHNKGMLFPYIASIVLCIGLLIHVVLRLPRLIKPEGVTEGVTEGMKKGVHLLVFLGMMGLSLSLSSHSHAATSYDYQEFARVPILDQGRIKPLDSFARTSLKMIYGRESLSDMEAIEWLAELILVPEHAYHRKIFKIVHPNIVHALTLEKRTQPLYDYTEIMTAFSTHPDLLQALFTRPAKEMDLAHKQLLDLFTKIQLFSTLSRSLSLLFPETDTGDSHNDQNSQLFKIIPPQWSVYGTESASDQRWFSPWGIGVHGQGSPKSALFLKDWSSLILAYRDGNRQEWNALTSTIKDTSLQMARHQNTAKNLEIVLDIEVLFNQIKPFRASFIFYLLSFLMVMLSFIVAPHILCRVAFGFLVAGLISHATGIGMRMFIMQRPPVTNLYDSIIFVGFVVSMFGLLLERRLQNGIGIIVASSIGTLLHLVGIKFNADGDTMGILVAVLDTNFWLSTHVIAITIGYGCCLVGSVLAHIYVIQKLFNPHNEADCRILSQSIKGVVLVALLFTALGTILGGIWADQSWGRFWGWDPKENGALLIVLWLIFLLHGRLSGAIGELGFVTGMIGTNIIVAMAWFGVNLLSVGLHSYGFTDTARLSFFGFCALELLFALSTYALIRIRDET